MVEEDIRRLFVCVDKDTQNVFFASMIHQKGVVAEMRTSWQIDQVKSIYMLQVPEKWDGQKFTSDDIVSSPKRIEAHISRTAGRGSFHIRILSFEEQDVQNRIRTGQISEDNLKIEIKESGKICTIQLKGRIALESGAKLQKCLSCLREDQFLVLLDVTELVYMANSGIGMIFLSLKESIKQGRTHAILVKEHSPAEALLLDSKIPTIVPICTTRDDAVMELLRNTLI